MVVGTILPPTELLLFGLLDIFPIIAGSLCVDCYLTLYIHLISTSTCQELQRKETGLAVFFFLTQLAQQD